MGWHRFKTCKDMCCMISTCHGESFLKQESVIAETPNFLPICHFYLKKWTKHTHFLKYQTPKNCWGMKIRAVFIDYFLTKWPKNVHFKIFCNGNNLVTVSISHCMKHLTYNMIHFITLLLVSLPVLLLLSRSVDPPSWLYLRLFREQFDYQSSLANQNHNS